MFVGDGRLSVLPAGEARLISYALDQKMRIDQEAKQEQRIAKGRINRGLLELTIIDQQTTTYRIKAAAREARKLIIEQPRRAGWELVSLKQGQVELTEDRYRIREDLAAGGDTTIDVTLKRPRLQRLQLTSLPTQQLVAYAKTGELDGKLRAALEELAELKGAIEQHDRRLARLEKNRRRMFEEQKRIRDNLQRVPSNSDLHRRYIEKLGVQEDKLESLVAQIVQAEEDRNQAQERLQDRIAALKL